MPFSLYRTVSGQRVKQTISIAEAFSSRPKCLVKSLRSLGSSAGRKFSYRRTPKKETKDAATQYSPPSDPAAEAAAPPVPVTNEKADEPKATFTEAETKQLKELKAENKTWKQIAEIMKRDVEELKAHFKEVKDDNNAPPASGRGGGGDGAAATATEPKKDGDNTNKANEGGKKGKGGKKELTEEQKKQAEEKKAAGLARQAELKKQKEGGAVGTSKTTAPAPNARASAPTLVARLEDLKKTSEQEKKEARIKKLAPKVDGYYNKYLMVASRYFDETGTRISETEVRKIIG